MEEDSNELAYYALEFMAKWITRGKNVRPPVLLSVDEGLVVSTRGTTGRMYNAKLLDGSWAILNCALRQTKFPNPESYLAKIYGHASLGNLQKAFSTLHEFEIAYGNSTKEAEEDLLSPFTSLHPLVMACSKDGFVTLDSVVQIHGMLIGPTRLLKQWWRIWVDPQRPFIQCSDVCVYKAQQDI